MTLAIDIGGTKIAAANVIDGVCHDRRQQPMPATEAEFLATIATLAAGRPAPARAALAAVKPSCCVSIRRYFSTSSPHF